MAKSADAFRTISEVADWLETPAHVLRFWESKFSQVKPVKRAGGRRYYRPADMKLLGGIKKLLHDDGMTIKGVQKMLREQGVGSVSDFSQPLGDAADDVIIDHVADAPAPPPPEPNPEGAPSAAPTAPPASPSTEPAHPAARPAAHEPGPGTAATPVSTPQTPSETPAPEPQTVPDAPVPEPEIEETPLSFSRHKQDPETAPLPEPEATAAQQTEGMQPLPSFLQRREAPADTPEPPVEADPTPLDSSGDVPAPEGPPTPRPIAIDVPDDPEDDMTADPGVLTLLSKLERPLSREAVAGLETLVSRLRATTGSAARD